MKSQPNAVAVEAPTLIHEFFTLKSPLLILIAPLIWTDFSLAYLTSMFDATKRKNKKRTCSEIFLSCLPGSIICSSFRRHPQNFGTILTFSYHLTRSHRTRTMTRNDFERCEFRRQYEHYLITAVMSPGEGEWWLSLVYSIEQQLSSDTPGATKG